MHAVELFAASSAVRVPFVPASAAAVLVVASALRAFEAFRAFASEAADAGSAVCQVYVASDPVVTAHSCAVLELGMLRYCSQFSLGLLFGAGREHSLKAMEKLGLKRSAATSH